DPLWSPAVGAGGHEGLPYGSGAVDHRFQERRRVSEVPTESRPTPPPYWLKTQYSIHGFGGVRPT
ncbi:MAG: hypothetical protein NTU41_15290, partial [Chloroflexi bacterium]|nr:hypothetical protein [Chloroflexota bacterium]